MTVIFCNQLKFFHAHVLSSSFSHHSTLRCLLQHFKPLFLLTANGLWVFYITFKFFCESEEAWSYQLSALVCGIISRGFEPMVLCLAVWSCYRSSSQRTFDSLSKLPSILYKKCYINGYVYMDRKFWLPTISCNQMRENMYFMSGNLVWRNGAVETSIQSASCIKMLQPSVVKQTAKGRTPGCG